MKNKGLITLVTSLMCAFSCMNITASAVSYIDGTYTGSALGMNDDINVEVVVSNGEISSIEIVSHSDDEPYITDAQGVIDKIIANQSTDVDAVSGATYSSNGIIDAVKDALSNAEASDETEATTQEEDTTTTTATETSETSEDDTTTTTSSNDTSSDDDDDDDDTTTTISSEDTATQTGDNSLVGIAITIVACGVASFGVSTAKRKLKK